MKLSPTLKQGLALITTIVLAQLSLMGQTTNSIKERNKSFIDLGLECAPLLNTADVGMNFNWEEGIGKRLSIGLSTSIPMFYGHISNSYSVSTSNPQLGYFLLGLITEYKMIDSKKCNLYISLNNGYSNIWLGDGNHLQGKSHGVATPQTLMSNTYYSLQPGLHLALKLKDEVGFHFRVCYHLFYGNSEFGSANSFENISFSIGIGGLFKNTFGKHGLRLQS